MTGNLCCNYSQIIQYEISCFTYNYDKIIEVCVMSSIILVTMVATYQETISYLLMDPYETNVMVKYVEDVSQDF